MTNNQTQNSKTPGLPFRVLIFRIWNLFEIWDLKIGISCHITMWTLFRGLLSRDDNLLIWNFML